LRFSSLAPLATLARPLVESAIFQTDAKVRRGLLHLSIRRLFRIRSRDASRRATAPTGVRIRHRPWKLDPPPRSRARRQATESKNHRRFLGETRAEAEKSRLKGGCSQDWLPHKGSGFSWDFAGRRPIQTGQEAYRTWPIGAADVVNSSPLLSSHSRIRECLPRPTRGHSRNS
jgi:hypothetical protein